MSISHILGSDSQGKVPWKFLNVSKLYTNNIQMSSGAATGYVMTCLDSTGTFSWVPAAEAKSNVVRLEGTQSAYNVSDVSTIINSNTLANLTLNSLAGMVDGQSLTLIANNSGVITIKNNTTTGAPGEQIILTNTGSDIVIPDGGQNGTVYITYDATQGRAYCDDGTH